MGRDVVKGKGVCPLSLYLPGRKRPRFEWNAPLIAQRRLPNTVLGGLPKNRVKAALKLLGNL